MTAGPGTCVHVPQGGLHTFKNIGTSFGTFLVIVSLGGFENFFAEIDALPPGPPDMARVLQIATRHQIAFGPPRQA